MALSGKDELPDRSDPGPAILQNPENMSAAENPDDVQSGFEAQPSSGQPTRDVALDVPPALVTSAPARRRPAHGRAQRLVTLGRSLWIILRERPRR